jgi:N-acetylglucosamine-6-phosphate deacetylase
MAQQTAINAATPSTEQAEAKPRRNPVPELTPSLIDIESEGLSCQMFSDSRTMSV